MIADIVEFKPRQAAAAKQSGPQLGAQLMPFVTYAGPHPRVYGYQMILKFPNGRGASVAATATTSGLQMVPTRLVKGTWTLDGKLHADLDPDYLVELLLKIKDDL